MSLCISDLLKQSSARHDHLCPRQVLGVRIGLAGLANFGIGSRLSIKHSISHHRKRRLFCGWH